MPQPENSESSTTRDFATTAITHDGAFRVIVLRTTETVRAALDSQKVTGLHARTLADVLTATITVRLTMAPTYRVQGIVRGAGQRGTFVGDSHPDGTARALFQLAPGDEEVSLGPGALMQMMRTLPTGAVHQGVVEVPEASVNQALMGYFQASEQITSMVRVGSRFDDDGALLAAGGYLVQLLPEVSRAPLAVMTERLDLDFSDMRRVLDFVARDPAELLAEILYDMPYAETQRAELSFGCRCSSVRVLSSLSTLPRADIEELAQGGESVHITCDYCGAEYGLAPSALAGLLSES
jgi:molecular chaperone Hsp33